MKSKPISEGTPSLVKMPAENRSVRALANKVKAGIKTVNKQWDQLEVKELAEQIASLEEAAVGTGLESEVEHLQFEFVFPIGRELHGAFAGRLNQTAKKILSNQSLHPLQSLNDTQKWEITHLAQGG